MWLRAVASWCVLCCAALLVWAQPAPPGGAGGGGGAVFIQNRLDTCDATITEGYLCYNTEDNTTYVGNGAEAVPVGGTPPTPTIGQTFGAGNIIPTASITTPLIICNGGGSCTSVAQWQMYVSAANIPVLRAVDASGNPITEIKAIWDNSNWIVAIGDGAGGLSTCWTMTPAGVLTYAAVESCRPRKTVFLPASSLEPDGTQCTSVTAAAINSGPVMPLITCTDNDGSTVWATLVMPDSWDAGAITVSLEVLSDNATPSGDYHTDFAASCRGVGDAINSTVGTEQAADIDFDANGSCGTSACSQYDLARATTSAITPNGTCAAGNFLYIRGQVDATGTTATVTDVFIIGIRVEYQVTSTSD